MADNSDREMRLSLVTLLVRISLGVTLFFWGLIKFIGPGGYSGFVGWIVASFKDTWLPGFLLTPFAYLVPWAEVGLGLLLLIGLLTRYSLFLTGLYLTALCFGQVVLGKPDVVAHNLIYIILVAMGIWASEQDRFSLDRFRKKPE